MRVTEANAAIDQGDFGRAYSLLTSAIGDRLPNLKEGETSADALDLHMVSSAANLAEMLGLVEEAARYQILTNTLLREADELVQPARIKAFMTLRRAAMQLTAHDLNRALSIMSELNPRLAGAMSLGPLHGVFDERPYPWSIGSRDPLLALTFLLFGKCLAGKGRYQAARKLLNRALQTIPRSSSILDASELEVEIKLEQARVEIQCGDPGAALSILNAYGGPQMRDIPRLQVQWLTLLGRTYLLLGEFEKTMGYLQEAAVYAAQRHSTGLLANVLLNAAAWMVYLNRVELALTLLENYESIFAQQPALSDRVQAIKDAAIGFTSRLSDAGIAPVGDRYLDLGDTDIDRPIGEKDLAWIDRETDDFESDTNQISAQIHRHILEGDPNLVAAELQRLMSRYRRTDSPLIKGRLCYLCGLFAMSGHEIDTAIGYLEQGLDHFSDNDSLLDRWHLLNVLATCYSVDRRYSSARSANQRIDELLRTFLLNMSRENAELFLLDKWSDTDLALSIRSQELLRGSELRRVNTARIFGSERKLALLALDIAQHARVSRVGRLFEGKGDTAGSHQATLFDLVMYPSHLATVHFVVLATRTIVICSSKFQCQWLVAPLGRIDIRRLVSEWHSENRDWVVEFAGAGTRIDIDGSVEQSIRRLNLIGSQILDGLGLNRLLDRLPRRVKQIQIIPDDALHVLPFAALPFERQCLIDRFEICVAYEPRDGGQARGGNPRGCFVGYVREEFVALGPELRELPYAQFEAEAVSEPLEKLSGGRRVNNLIRSTTRSEFVESLPKVSWSHLIAHGTLDLRSPFDSALIFSGENGGPGYVSIRDILAIDLSHMDHIYLGSCYSAEAYVSPAMNVVSFPEAFARAGVDQIVGYLWPVVDQVAAELAVEYYHWRQVGGDLAGATRRAMIACREGRLPTNLGEAIRHPSFWAGLLAIQSTKVHK